MEIEGREEKKQKTGEGDQRAEEVICLPVRAGARTNHQDQFRISRGLDLPYAVGECRARGVIEFCSLHV